MQPNLLPNLARSGGRRHPARLLHHPANRSLDGRLSVAARGAATSRTASAGPATPASTAAAASTTVLPIPRLDGKSQPERRPGLQLRCSLQGPQIAYNTPPRLRSQRHAVRCRADRLARHESSTRATVDSLTAKAAATRWCASSFEAQLAPTSRTSTTSRLHCT